MRIFPPKGRQRLLVANIRSYKQALSMVMPSSGFSRVLLTVVRALRPLSYLLLTRKTRDADRQFLDLARHMDSLSIILPESYDSVNCYIGTPGPRQKYTAQIISQGEVSAYVKFGVLPESVSLIENERLILDHLNSSDLDLARFPELLGHLVNGDFHYVASTATGILSRRNLALDKVDIGYVGMLFNSNRRRMPYRSFLDESGLETRLYATADNGELAHLGTLISMSCNALQSCFKDEEILTGLSHGDYTPWNTLRYMDNSQYAFDWEYGCLHGPALADLFHFLRSVMHHVQHKPAIIVTHRILSGEDDEARLIHEHAESMGISKKLIPGYFMLYLLHEILRHAETRSENRPALQSYPNEVRTINYLTNCLSCTLDFTEGVKRLKVLVSAYACESDKGSEPGVGWNWVREISEHHEVWIITKANNRDSIERGLEKIPSHHMHFEYVDLPRWMAFWKKKQRGVRTYYYLWQFAALKKAISLNRRVGFDIAHHVTFVNDWLWSFLALFPVPYIWGPIGSHPPFPAALSPSSHTRRREFVRLFIQRFLRVLDPLYLLTLIRARHIIAINEQCARQFPIGFANRSRITITPAIAIEPINNPLKNREPGKTRILFVGRFHYVKCPDLAIEAFSGLINACPDSELIMVGRGPEEASLRKLATKLGLSEHIHFEPWQSRSSIFELMQTCDIFLFPSVEGGGLVVLEALAAGLPVLCLDYGGPGTMVDENVGRAIRMLDRKQVISDMKSALVDIAMNKELRERLSSSATRKAATLYTWKEKGDLSNKLYKTVIKD